MRLITYSREIVDGIPIYVSSNSLPVKALNLEPAGHEFHVTALRLLGHCTVPEAENEDRKETSKAKDQAYVDSSSSYSSNKGKKKSGETNQQDHYALLGLGHLRYLATEDQIRKSHRETSLRHHLDKQATLLLAEKTETAKEAKNGEIENHFKAIQESYEVLIDPVRRRIYDSTDEFDDEIPYDCAAEDFFKVFGPAFLRNGRWSVNQTVPILGDDSTTIKDVDSFYNFWYSFKSWREFPHADEFNVEQAESRDHKRWMERQNAKLSEKARKEDYSRIRTLVDNAYKRDPRIARRKEEQKAEKRRKKEEKLMAKKLQEAAAATVIEEEDKKAAEASQNQKKLKEKEKKLLRKERTRLRTLSNSILSQKLPGLTDSDVEDLCSSLDKEQLKNLCDRMEGKEGLERAKLLKMTLESGHESKDEKQDQKNSQHNGSVTVSAVLSSSAEKKEKPWNKEEIELLRKGMLKYPKGTSRRWEVISEYICTGRSVDEILKATKTVLLQKPGTARAFDSFLEKRKPAQGIASPLTTRDGVQGSNGNVTESNGICSDNVTLTSIQSENDLKPDNGINGIASDSDRDAWSVVQERALVQALKTFPKETAQRWERVSAAVPGKTVGQCKKMFALMKETSRSNIVAEKDNSKAGDSRDSSSQNENYDNSNDSKAVNVIASCSDEETWSEVQEKALIQALKTFPKATNQRWKHIAAAVPGKNVNCCKKKFASLKKNFRNKKNAV